MKFISIAFIFLGVWLSANAQETFKVKNHITDSTRTLGAAELETLNNRLVRIEKATGRQIVVVMLPTTGGSSIEDYATDFFRLNGIGSAAQNDGVLVLVAKDDRRMRIEVGYGLEGTITDLIADGIINQQMKPRFRDGDFYEGLEGAVTVIENLITGRMSQEELDGLKNGNSSKGLTKFGRAFLAVMGVAFLLGMAVGYRKSFLKTAFAIYGGCCLLALLYLRQPWLLLFLPLFACFPAFGGYLLVKYKGARILALAGAVIIAAVGMIARFFGGEIAMIVIFILFGLLMLTLVVIAVAKGGSSSAGGDGWRSSDTWSSGSSASTGSFSGGGGSSGGGGASGSW